MKYKNSIYNVLIPTEDSEKITIWNTRSGSVLRLLPDVWSAIINESFGESCISDFIDGLYNQGVIVPYDFNEYNAILFSRRTCQYAPSSTFSLIIAPTLACNFKCEYCFEKGKNHGKIMEEETKNKIIEFVENRFKNEKNTKTLSVTWFGGEPLLGYKAIITSLSESLISLCEKYGINYNSYIVTNGYYMSADVIPSLVKDCRITNYQITLDGPEAEYCKKKKATPEEYKTVIDNIFALSSYTFDNHISCQINIRINVDKSNYQIAKELVDDLTSDERYRNNIFFYLGKIQGDGCGCFNLEEFESVQKDFEKFTNSKLQDILPTKCVWCDQQTLNNFCIGPNGEIYKCERDFGDTAKVVGSLFTGLNYSDHLLGFFDPGIYDKCKSCKLFPVCLGGCPTIALEKGYECISTLDRAIELVKREYKLF